MLASLSNPRPENPAGYGFEYYLRNRAKGLDLLDYGEWHRRYGRWIVESLQLHGKRVLDVGCACGSMLRGMLFAGADIDGVDCSEFLIQLGREQWPEMGSRLSICDAVNLHHVRDANYDCIHSCSVAEHWRPNLVPYILEELQRVVKPGGSFYCAYESDTGTKSDGYDPAAEQTHLCLRRAHWWETQLRQAGWLLASSEYEPRLREHPDSFFPEYACSWFVASRPP